VFVLEEAVDRAPDKRPEGGRIAARRRGRLSTAHQCPDRLPDYADCSRRRQLVPRLLRPTLLVPTRDFMTMREDMRCATELQVEYESAPAEQSAPIER